ncbi:hypothetical protein [Shinella sp.]|uniref:hypothetical protein n=1 Tax=Shinella sp. TaxID=1870904 RepID=UPI003C706891
MSDFFSNPVALLTAFQTGVMVGMFLALSAVSLFAARSENAASGAPEGDDRNPTRDVRSVR